MGDEAGVVNRTGRRKFRSGRRRKERIMATTGTPVEVYRGYQVYFAASSYNCPVLKLWGYRTELAIRKAIVVHGVPVGGRGPPWPSLLAIFSKLLLIFLSR
jgi:hypothetical protein